MYIGEMKIKSFHPMDAVRTLRGAVDGNALAVAGSVATELENYCAFRAFQGVELLRIDIPDANATKATEAALSAEKVADGFGFNAIMQDFGKAMAAYDNNRLDAKAAVRHCRLLAERLLKYAHYCRINNKGLPVFPYDAFDVVPAPEDIIQDGVSSQQDTMQQPKRRGRPPKAGGKTAD